MHSPHLSPGRLAGVLPTLAILAAFPASGGAAEEPFAADRTGPAAASADAFQVEDTVPATLTGVVFDSTRARVLSGARVAVIGTAVTAVSDSSGAFRLTGIPPGEYSVSFHHPRLQELGVSPGVRMVSLASGEKRSMTLTIPSRPTILRGWCALEREAVGSAHLAGIVTDSLTGVPLPNARVELGAAAGGEQPLEARTDERGRYRFCGVSGEGWRSLRVRFGGEASEPVAIRPVPGAEIIEDFSLALSHEVRIVGKVLDRETLAPLEGAHVQVAGEGVEGMSDAEGDFGFTGLPPGRHVLITRNLGYEERTDTLTVFSREALGVEVRLSTEPIPLEPLVVVGRSRGRETPWSVGTRQDDMTRSEIEAVLHRTADAADLLRLSNIPGLNVRRVAYKDDGFTMQGLCVELSRSRRLAPETCAMVSVYVNGVHLPSPEYTLPDLDHRGFDRIQVLSPVEAGAAYGDGGRNGVLLIFTR